MRSVATPTPTVTVSQVRAAREQARAQGHRYVSGKQYCEHVDALLARIEELEWEARFMSRRVEQLESAARETVTTGGTYTPPKASVQAVIR